MYSKCSSVFYERKKYCGYDCVFSLCCTFYLYLGMGFCFCRIGKTNKDAKFNFRIIILEIEIFLWHLMAYESPLTEIWLFLLWCGGDIQFLCSICFGIEISSDCKILISDFFYKEKRKLLLLAAYN